ncbi:alpha/beta-hydrolase [Punctularia strigosozonata HHB-11173 SS5]|uniref:alpha/beta-hydrolase n=1 Tax=Punctularia strigosozonata (strain HHB-11173) TaxID=741275 RepID=UPI00044182FC|nr:alpha/beta-hydrolase [Punctularia strigosozonata HHB-11173 SS5]EIN13236.1 alpha/beta-hydrolase [Punctularia strigosozonata HHB-11173 SS5]
MRILSLQTVLSGLSSLSTLGNSTTPVVVTKSAGTFVGEANTTTSIDAFLGIPFAQPPVGPLRFKAPVAVPATTGTYHATSFGNACPQPLGYPAGAPLSEDCLYLNIFRPAGTNVSSALPVLAWIYGGAYTTGSASLPSYSDPTPIIQRSIELGKPIMFAAMNYRVNTFGFLASRYVPSEDLNAGLQDQRLALEWLQDNIASFGGDPTKVTIWGQSAGGGSVEAHILFPANRTLFRAGIADSSTGPFKSSPYPHQYDEPGKPYARLTSMVGCPLDSTSFACLQRIPFEIQQTLMNVSNSLIEDTLNGQLWQPAVGPPGSLLPERQSARIASGAFARVPYLAGTNNNEGTRLSVDVYNRTHDPADEDALFDDFVGRLILDKTTLSAETLATIRALYPANGTNNGAPFQTGDSLFDRAEAWYGDNMYLAPRLAHGSELKLLFGRYGVPSSHAEFATNFTDAYINFVHDMDPGPSWPRYTADSKLVLQWTKDNITAIDDDWDLERTGFLNSPRVLDEFEK